MTRRTYAAGIAVLPVLLLLLALIVAWTVRNEPGRLHDTPEKWRTIENDGARLPGSIKVIETKIIGW